MLYVPNYNNSQCAYIYSDGVIRVYDSVPNSPGIYNYTDYYTNMHYQSRNGSTTFSTYSNYPVCSDSVTTNYFYRNDIVSILIIFTIFVGFTWFLVSKLIKTLFHGGKRL